MPRKRKQEVKVNNISSLEGILQEAYGDACLQLLDTQSGINILTTSTTPQDVDDHTKIAKEKAGFLKVKDSAIRTKLEIAKILNEIIKSGGNAAAGLQNATNGEVSMDDFKKVREHINKASEESFEDD